MQRTDTGSASELSSENENQICLLKQLLHTVLTLKHAYEAEMGISPHAARLLCILAEHDGITQNELSELMWVDASTITRVVKSLERQHGWIVRERDEDDNRVVRVHLTEAGKEQACVLPQCFKQLTQSVTRYLSEDDKAQFYRMLLQIKAGADQTITEHEQFSAS